MLIIVELGALLVLLLQNRNDVTATFLVWSFTRR
jgi:hypothetical protein